MTMHALHQGCQITARTVMDMSQGATTHDWQLSRLIIETGHSFRVTVPWYIRRVYNG